MFGAATTKYIKLYTIILFYGVYKPGKKIIAYWGEIVEVL